MVECGEIWEVIGGAAKGGIIVRAEKHTNSAEIQERLSTGAKVRIVDKAVGRVGYELLSGDGPKTGWVSTKCQGKDLIAKVEAQDDCYKALQDYGNRFGALSEHPQQFLKRQNFTKKQFTWNPVVVTNVQSAPPSDEQVQAEFEREVGLQRSVQGYQAPSKARTTKDSSRLIKHKLKGWAEDSDGEDVRICHHCKLPMGEMIYRTEKGKDYVHGECLAHLMVQDLRTEEEIRIKEERVKKQKQHLDYGIGWNVSKIPRNVEAASKLAMRDVPQGMVCLVLDEGSKSIRLASTLQPSATINLEYLSIALEVRRTEGTEPIFSLEPVNPEDKKSMQEKLFSPEWLAGTSLGEAMFQADYHLKELSMGEFDQPVVGMKSCFDYTEIENQYEWNAREWFLVRKAEIQLSENNMIIPMVKMGVEAREQVIQGNGLQDKPVTRRDHPMVKYAEDFTRNFDLIAERRSVIYQLRELAKASVIAKYLLDADMQLEESWFHLAQEREIACSLQVPQLWNERVHSQLQVADGTIGKHSNTRTHAVYGGVQFGLQRFNLATSIAQQASREGQKPPSMQPLSALLSAQMPKFGDQKAGAGLSAVAPITPSPSRLGAALSAASLGAPQMPVTRSPALSSAFMSQPASAGLSGAAVPSRLQGVDLRLDQFDLSEAKHVSLEASVDSWSGQVKSLNECVAMGSAFFASLDGSAAATCFKPDDHALLNSVFSTALSDRRDEGDLFVPPDVGYLYVSKLRDLVKEEEAVRQARKEQFFSVNFMMGDPGSLFPHSWTPSFAISKGCAPAPEGHPQGALRERPEFTMQAIARLRQFISSSPPIFDKTTEEGLRFRIYRSGSLEVRTTQAPGEEEIVGAAFSILNKASKLSSTSQMPAGHEKIVKVAEYVERDFTLGTDPSSLQRRYYIVLETEDDHKVVLEKSCDGSLAWIENPDDLEDRNALAKVTRTQKVKHGITLEIMKAYQEQLAEYAPFSSKHLARMAFAQAAGANAHKSNAYSPMLGSMLRF